MGDTGGVTSVRSKMKSRVEEEDDSEEEVWDSDDDDETIARIQRAHYAQAAAMNPRRRAPPRPRPMSHKRKLEAVKNFHDFTKKLKKDTGISIRSLVGNNILELSDFSSEDSKSESDGLSEEEFVVNPNAVQELEEENESYIDPVTGDIVECKKTVQKPVSSDIISHHTDLKQNEEPKTLSISDIINEGIDLSKNFEIAEVETSELCPDKCPEDLLDIKQDEASQDFDESNNGSEMHNNEVKPQDKLSEEEGPVKDEKKPETEEEKKLNNLNAINVRRNIREVMDEKNLDASTLTAQRQESERLARVQEQQRIIREVQRQIAMNRQNKIHQKTLSLLQGGSSILKKSGPGQKLNLPNTVTVKMPSGEIKRTIKHGQVELTKVQKPTTSAMFSQKLGKLDQKSEKKEVVEIVDSSSGEETSSSSSDSDDCIMLSDSEVPPSPEAEEDPANSGLHVNDTYNIPDEQGRVLINIGHPESEEDIFLAPQIARIIKPHQIGGVRFLFDNIIESVERFSTSAGFGCILAHSMGLGKTLQIVSFCDIFLRHTTSKTVLCIMPINTLQNWVAEFNMWLPLDASHSPLAAHGEVRPRNFPIYVLNDSHKTLQMRAKVVKDWTATGGVLMIGYELYRLLSMKKDKKPRKKKKAELKAEAEKEKEAQRNDRNEVSEEMQGSESNMSKPEESRGEKDEGEIQHKNDLENKEREEKKEDSPADEDKKLLDEMYEALVRPGPDLVICDEGHRIKNSHSNISYALKQMRTKRRVVLTGYPLQNNLLEYWCMVDFVRPNYLGSKTEFCNMFERPIQNGQCIDSTPQDIRLMRYRAHVLHSLLVGFVQRRSHAVLQSTLPQKEEYVLLVRMTPLQRKLYDKFMNEVVRTTSVPNPLKAFAICCKIWNHPDVLYNFLRKRNEVNMAIEEDLDLEEIGGVTKAGRQTRSRGNPKKAAKPRGSKKPAATIPPNTTGSGNVRQDAGTFGNTPFPPNGPYPGPPGLPGQPGMPDSYRSGRPEASYPPYQEYHNPGPGYYPPNQGYNQEFNSNYYQQPQPPYGNNYPNQYPQNNSDCNQGYNQNYWNNSNYYGNPGYYNNPQYPNSQPQPEFAGNPPPNFNNSQPYPSNFNTMDPNNQPYPNNQIPQYPGNQDNFANQHRPPFQGPLNQTTPGYPAFDSSASAPTNYPSSQPPQNYSNAPYQPPSFPGNSASYGSNVPPTYNQYNNPNPNYPAYGNNPPPNQSQSNPLPNQTTVKTEMNVDPNYQTTERKPEPNYPQNNVPFENSYNYHQQNPLYPNQPETGASGSYPCQYPPFSSNLETKPPLDSAGSPVTAWPITDTIKTEIDKLKLEDKIEMKSESDGEVKIEDLDTKKIVKDETKRDISKLAASPKNQFVEGPTKDVASAKDATKSDKSESDEAAKKGKQKGKGKDSKKAEKPKARGRPNAKGRKDRKSSKDKNNEESESEESEKEEKMNKEEELAMVKKAEEMTYDWAAELLKDYVPGIIENSAKMELFFYLLNESIKVGDRLLLFSQSLFTLNLIEDFLEKNYIPGTVSLWQRNVSYYRLDGSTHALEREKLINEFNSNPNIYLFLVSTRAGSLGINLVGANRVIVFDASWNPCHDTQAVCRVYRYGQQKPCFVYRFVMDWCLEKKIYDRQINKQGMADRVVDECNPDAVLSMKEITNLCFDNDEKESEVKDLSEHAEKYVDLLMQGILTKHGTLLSKEPFQHESLLVDRKEKKLSSAEKRLAQRGYELEKKAALAPKPTGAYRAVRTADGTVVQRPVASVRPMQHARWIPADVWRRQGMTAQEMTLPLDVVIPTNSAEKTNIVLKAGQRVMVLKSPKGIYMQLESGKIIAIKTSLKGLQKGSEVKEGTPIGKKVLSNRAAVNIPGSLKNNSAITITSKTGVRPGMQRVMSRPSMLGQNKMRPVLPGQKIAEIRSRLGDMKSYTAMRPKIPMNHARLLRPNLPGSVSITRIPKQIKKPTNIASNESKKMDLESDDDPQVLDSDEEEDSPNDKKEREASEQTNKKEEPESKENNTELQKSDAPQEAEKDTTERDQKNNDSEPMVLTTDEKLPPEDALENKSINETLTEMSDAPSNQMNLSHNEMHEQTPIEKKINLLKNYRHQRPFGRPQTESSLTQLERTASTLNNEGVPDFRRNLDDITQSYSPITDEKTNNKSRKKKSPTKIEITPEPRNIETPVNIERPPIPSSNMSHSVSSLLGTSTQKPRVDPMLSNHLPKPRMSDSIAQNLSLSGPRPNPLGMSHDNQISPLRDYTMGQSLDHSKHMGMGPALGNIGLMGGPPVTPNIDVRKVPGSLGDPLSSPMPTGALKPVHPYPTPNPPPEVSYGQYPGYGMGYGAYPNPAYYAGYGGAYYPPYAPPTTTPSVPPPDYLPSNQQW
ncbi:Helicase ARIP4 [Papilio xuthus]|uniref:Helicase ARIP4 n=1 Tax=Papilio xuthus TaxID=66420 RepID=A0A194PX74_PAPXU|nr:Helicase ARIP4 [Papilio xuthus]